MAVMTPYFHIELNDEGVPMISGTTMKVVELVLDHLAYGWSPEELRYQHPYLTMGQVYSALAYYSDHQEELDRFIDRHLEQDDAERQRQLSSPVIRRLRAVKYE
jgi:uncharacterized protein (DUF433 family)